MASQVRSQKEEQSSQEVVSGGTDARRQEPRMAGKQFGMLSEQWGVSGGRKACGAEGRDWVKVVGKGAIPGPLPVGPLCAH